MDSWYALYIYHRVTEDTSYWKLNTMEKILDY